MKCLKKGKYIIGCLVIVLIGFLFVRIFTYHPVKSHIEIEAGAKELKVSDVLEDQDAKAVIKNNLTTEQLKTVGEYEIQVIVDDKEYTCAVNVKDTTAPKAVLQTVKIYQNQKIEPKMFIKEVQDVSKVSIKFKDEVKTSSLGQHKVTLILEDQAKNKSEVTGELNIMKDKTPPVIKGTKDIIVTKGKTASYKKGVTVSDNVDKDIELEIDSSKVNLNKVGSYKVVYKATDKAGNTTKKEIKVTVEAPVPKAYNLETVYKTADAILKGIINDNMTQRQKCQKIYNWIHGHIGYVDYSDKSSWTKGAMDGFNNRRGDCYNYFAMSKALLTRAGIENIDLKATKHKHYWNFVKVEEGWYHFDTTPRWDHPNLCLRTDAWMNSYSVKNDNCFSYDPASKPASAKR